MAAPQNKKLLCFAQSGTARSARDFSDSARLVKRRGQNESAFKMSRFTKKMILFWTLFCWCFIIAIGFSINVDFLFVLVIGLAVYVIGLLIILHIFFDQWRAT